MAKCNICSTQIEELFLGKIKGTIIQKSGSKKQYYVCPKCQSEHKTKDELLSKL
jgi:hypothetical protein